jgi:enolase-phosphatase E1
MDQDRKSTPLKSLQGKIWEEGYRSGELRSQVFDDVPPAFERWNKEQKLVCIYSSGSVLAQKLLFAYTNAGDLTKYIFNYFDTTIGSKVESGSYLAIAGRLGLPPAEIVFASDVVAELDAAHAAGLRTVCVVRPGNRPIEHPILHHTITSF